MTKPVVFISEAFVIGGQLYGNVHNYPADHMVYTGDINNEERSRVRTSKIVHSEGNTVETERTIYNVTSWAKDI